MKITWIVQNLILNTMHMMVFSKEFQKIAQTSKNYSLPPMASPLLLTKSLQPAISVIACSIGELSSHEFVPMDTQHFNNYPKTSTSIMIELTNLAFLSPLSSIPYKKIAQQIACDVNLASLAQSSHA